MFSIVRFITLLALVVLTAACAENTSQVADLPTLAVLPSPTASNTPSPTPEITATPTTTATETPTATATETATATATITATLTPSALPASPTSTMTATPTATSTVAASPTANQPVILSFNASSANVTPNQPITLTWEASADSARIERLNQAGTVVDSITVPPSGSSTLTVPGGEPTVIYRLTAIRAGFETSLSLTVAVAVSCQTPWFFPNPPANLGCPSGAASSVPGAYQSFQNGFIFRIQYNGLDRVCGVQNQPARYTCVPYLVYSGTPAITPPAGTLPPGPDFQELFYNRLAIGGPWYDVIGWGTSTMTSSSLTVQPGPNGGIYVNLPAGIYRFDAALTNGLLERVNNQ